LAIFVERSSTIERYHHPPPNLETIVSSFTRVLFLLQLRAIYKCNFKSAHLQVQFTSAIYKLRSTTGQMPALVFTYGSGDHAGNVENNLLGTPNFPHWDSHERRLHHLVTLLRSKITRNLRFRILCYRRGISLKYFKKQSLTKKCLRF
jgi:hypothetical protein